jgi:hypothetical protein
MDSATLDKAVALTKEFVAAATPIAKQAYELGLVTIQITAIQSLLVGVMWLILCGVCIHYGRKFWQSAADVPPHEDKDGLQIISVFTYAAGVGTGVGFLIQFFNIWTWVALFRPDIWLVHAAIQKVM